MATLSPWEGKVFIRLNLSSNTIPYICICYSQRSLNFTSLPLYRTNPLELEGVVQDNPWTFKVRTPERFLARYVAPSSLPNAETQSQGGGTRVPEERAREVYSFSAGRGDLTTNLRPTANARKNTPAEREVIDLTFLDDSPPRVAHPARPKSASRKSNHTSGPESKRARAVTAPSIPSPTLPAAAAPAAAATVAPSAGDGTVTTGIMEEFTCPICQELIVSAYSVVPCGHNFCGTCLSEWLANKQDCPNCRQRCTAPPVRALAVDNIIALTIKGLDDHDKKVYEDRKKEWDKNKTAIEQKLKNSAERGGGGSGAGGSGAYGRGGPSGIPMVANFVGMMPGLMHHNGPIPGMDYLLQGISGGGRGYVEPMTGAAGTNPNRNRILLSSQAPQSMSGEQRFRCQYATAAGGRCKGCRNTFNNTELILGMKTVPARSGRHVGYDWYHFQCFPQAGFRNARVAGFENMRNISGADASRIRERLVM